MTCAVEVRLEIRGGNNIVAGSYQVPRVFGIIIVFVSGFEICDSFRVKALLPSIVICF